MSSSRVLARVLRCITVSRSQTAPFSVLAPRMAEGDAGAPRSGGMAQGDSFTKREEANENYYVKQREQEKLAALRKRMQDHEDELKKTKDEIDALGKK